MTDRDNPKLCEQCGNATQEDDEFCGVCGERVPPAASIAEMPRRSSQGALASIRNRGALVGAAAIGVLFVLLIGYGALAYTTFGPGTKLLGGSGSLPDDENPPAQQPANGETTADEPSSREPTNVPAPSTALPPSVGPPAPASPPPSVEPPTPVPPPPPAAPPTPAPREKDIAGSVPKEESRSAPTRFVIRDQLGPNQIAEEVDIIIDGEHVGTLAVDQNNTTDELNVSVPGGPGRYSYTASARAIFQDQQRRRMPASGTGQGMIEIQGNEVFELVGSFSGDTWQVTMLER